MHSPPHSAASALGGVGLGNSRGVFQPLQLIHPGPATVLQVSKPQGAPAQSCLLAQWLSARSPSESTGPYLYHLGEITSICQLQDNVKFIVFNERIQIFNYIGVVQLL